MASKPRRVRRNLIVNGISQARRNEMAKSFNKDEEKVIQNFRRLSPDKKRQAIDYLDLLAQDYRNFCLTGEA
jgi:hypothetical protein